MAKKNTIDPNEEKDPLDEEIDFSRMPVMPRGRLDPQKRLGTNIVVLDPDIAKAFPTDEAVNEALRLILKASALASGVKTSSQ